MSPQKRKAAPAEPRNGLGNENRQKLTETSKSNLTHPESPRLDASRGLARAYRYIVQSVTTRDLVEDADDFDGWTCTPVPPPGDGWVIADSSAQYKTRWVRFRMVPRITSSEEGE